MRLKIETTWWDLKEVSWKRSWKKKERKGKQANRGGKMGDKNDYGV